MHHIPPLTSMSSIIKSRNRQDIMITGIQITTTRCRASLRLWTGSEYRVTRSCQTIMLETEHHQLQGILVHEVTMEWANLQGCRRRWVEPTLPIDHKSTETGLTQFGGADHPLIPKTTSFLTVPRLAEVVKMTEDENTFKILNQNY